MPKANGVGYDWGKNEYLYSFLGMAPVEDPQLVMYIAVSKTKARVVTEAGSEPVSQIFNSVMENSLKYLNINPDNMAEAEMVTVPEYGRAASRNSSS